MKIGDIIENGTKRVTKVFILCGGEAYQTEPVGKDFKAPEKDFPMNPPVESEEPVKEEPKKTVRRRKKA